MPIFSRNIILIIQRANFRNKFLFHTWNSSRNSACVTLRLFNIVDDVRQFLLVRFGQQQEQSAP